MSFPNRLRFATLALAIVGLGIALVVFWPALHVVPTPRAREATVYLVTFPAEPVPVDGWKGHYSIPIRTNLPEGTMVDLEYRDELGEGGGCCNSVVAGVIQAPLVNNHCLEKGGTLQGSRVKVQVVIASNYGFMIYGAQGATIDVPGQPDSILAVLGPNFEDLEGPDVLVHTDRRMLIAWSGEYQLPAETCVSPYSH